MTEDILQFGHALVTAQPGLLRKARRLTGRQQDARRLVRETLDAAWRLRRQVRVEADLGRWLEGLLRDRYYGTAPFGRLAKLAEGRGPIEAAVGDGSVLVDR